MAYTRPDNLTLGCIAKDSISGFEGVVIAITEWLNGCQRITISPQKLDEHGKRIESDSFDAEQIIVVKPAEQSKAAKTGGPPIAPVRSMDPKRF